MIPKKLITDVSFDFKKGDKFGDDGEVSYNPHIAYTLKSQNGAASGINSPFLLKSDDLKISEEDKAMVEEIKKSENSEIKKLAANKEANLRTALKERFPKEDGDYSYGVWVETFDADYVYFEKQGKTYSLSYKTGMHDMVELGDEEPVEVVRQIKFVPMEMMEEMMTPEMMMEQMMRMMMMNMGDMDMSGMDAGMMEMMKSVKKDLMSNSEVSQKEGETSEITKGDDNVETDKLNIEELLKSKELESIIKGMVDEQTKEAKDEAKAAQEIAKAAQDALDAKEQEEIVKAQSDLTEVVKGWGVDEELTEEVVKGIFGNSHSEALIKAFESLSEEVVKTKESFGTNEYGQEVKVQYKDDIQKSKDLVSEIIKKNKKNK